jgi:arylsulfatase A-like enzyme
LCEGGNRVPAFAWGPEIKPGSKNSDIVGGLDYMATFASLASVKLPENDREGKPIIFDSYDMSPLLFGIGKSERQSWFYFTENELSPGAVRYNNYKFCSTCVVTMGQRPVVWLSTAISAGKEPRNMWLLYRRCSISGKTRKSAMTSS